MFTSAPGFVLEDSSLDDSIVTTTEVIRWASGLLASHGYPFLLAIGLVDGLTLPLPSGILLLVAGGLAHRGGLTPAPAIGVFLLGFLAGSYLAVRFAQEGMPALFGAQNLEKAIRKGRGAKVRKWWQAYGLWVVLANQLAWRSLRFPLTIVSAAMGVRPVAFAVTAVAGNTLWAAAWFSLGYFSVGSWPLIPGYLRQASEAQVLLYGLIAALGLILLYRILRRERVMD